MVSVITFLTLTNIALGYGLAVYVNRHFGTLIFSRHKKQHILEAKLITTQQSEEDSANTERSKPTSRVESQLEQAVSETAIESKTPEKAESEEAPSLEAQSPSDEIAAVEPVDEENVLAGIEEFRSQLAKMSEAPAPTADERQEELVGAAN